MIIVDKTKEFKYNYISYAPSCIYKEKVNKNIHLKNGIRT